MCMTLVEIVKSSADQLVVVHVFPTTAGVTVTLFCRLFPKTFGIINSTPWSNDSSHWTEIRAHFVRIPTTMAGFPISALIAWLVPLRLCDGVIEQNFNGKCEKNPYWFTRPEWGYHCKKADGRYLETYAAVKHLLVGHDNNYFWPGRNHPAAFLCCPASTNAFCRFSEVVSAFN